MCAPYALAVNVGFVVMVDESVTEVTVAVYHRGLFWDTKVGECTRTLPTAPPETGRKIDQGAWTDLDGGTGTVHFALRIKDSRRAFTGDNLDPTN